MVSEGVNSAQGGTSLRYRGNSVLQKNRTCSSLSGSTKPLATLSKTIKINPSLAQSQPLPI